MEVKCMTSPKDTFTAVLTRDEDGVFIIRCPALPGCHSYGRTKREALNNIREAIEAHLELYRRRGESIPEEVSVEAVHIG
jgi:antitoxin HicB